MHTLHPNVVLLLHAMCVSVFVCACVNSTMVLEGLMKHLKRQFSMQLPDHDLTVEAAWPQLFVDHKGKYWDVPESISVDLSSLVSESGLRYRFGIHKNGGNPQAINATDSSPPLSLLPGLCAKAAFTYEKIKYFWRDKEAEEDQRSSYDVRLRKPHAAVSGIIGKFS